MIIAYDDPNFDWYNFKGGSFNINKKYCEIHLPVKKADDGYYYQGIAYITSSDPQDGDDPEYEYVNIRVKYSFDWDGRYSASNGYYYDSQRYKKLYNLSKEKGLPEEHRYRSKSAKKKVVQTTLNAPSMNRDQFSVDAEKMTSTPIIDEIFVMQFAAFLANWAGWISTVGKTVVDSIKEGLTKEDALKRARGIAPPANSKEMLEMMNREAQRKAELRRQHMAQAKANQAKFGNEGIYKPVDTSKGRAARRMPNPPVIPKSGLNPYVVKGLVGASRALTALAIIGLGAEGAMVLLNYLEWQNRENGPSETFYKHEFELSLLGWGNSLVLFAGSVGVGAASAEAVTAATAAAATTGAAIMPLVAVAGIGSLWAALDLVCYYTTGDHLPIFVAKTVTHAAGAHMSRATGGAVNEYGLNTDFSSWAEWWGVKFQ